MFLIGIITVLISLHSPFAVDSTIFTVDIPNSVIREQKLHSAIIDYCLDDFLYVLTKRNLYKIDPDDLHIIDRTILPQTYTSMCVNNSKVLLIAAGEIVILAKSHLAYESGIGIKHGDLRPLVSPQGRTIASDEVSLYVIEDRGSESLLKIIDLNNGNVRKVLKTAKIMDYMYSVTDRTFTTLDIQDHLLTYDLSLKRTASTPLPMAVEWFLENKSGFWTGTHSGVYLISSKGSLIDLQPLMEQSTRSYEDFIFVINQNIVCLDSLTLRTHTIVPNDRHITRFFSVGHPSFVIGMDEQSQFYFIHTPTMNIHPRVTYESITTEIQPRMVPMERDSLWYLQIGAFSNAANAITLHAEMRARAIPVFIDTAEVYRVKLGGFYDKQLGIFVADNLNINGWFSLQNKILNHEYVHFFVDQMQFVLKDGIITRSEP